MNDRDPDRLVEFLGVGGCLLSFAYDALRFRAWFDLVHHYWGFNFFASLVVVMLFLLFVRRFPIGLGAIPTVLGAWLAWKWPLVGAMAFGMPPALVVGVAILLGGGFVAVLAGVRDRVFGKRA